MKETLFTIKPCDLSNTNKEILQAIHTSIVNTAIDKITNNLLAPNDTVYKWCSCHGICKHCHANCGKTPCIIGGPICRVFLASRPCRHAGWLELFQIFWVDNNTNTLLIPLICKLIAKPIHVDPRTEPSRPKRLVV